MFRIALCKDDADRRKLTYELLNQYISAQGLAARIHVFPSERELLNAMLDESFDIYLLDIVMPGMNGIELGREIRKNDRDGSIFHLTSSLDFALESYQTKTASYLLKPLAQQELFAVLDDAVAVHIRRWENVILVKSHGGMMRLLADDILYAELRNRSVSYCLQEGSMESMTITTSFKEAVAPLLNCKNFLLCASSFIVNLHQIKMVDKGGAPPQLMFRVSNPYHGEMQFDQKGFPIAPNTSHGLGTRSIAAYCEKHRVSCEYRAKDGWFTIQIVQPIWTN